MARKIASELANAGVCVVSGMARGIDSEAHAGAIEAGGRTVAFLGSGLDIIYPPENLELYRKIISSGAVLSEFPLGRRADRRTFPMRNRLVAGVSLGVLVVESASSGGSMITAKFAAEQGRSVFALPGRVDQAESQGCLDLIRDGATLIRNTEDILEEIAPMIPSNQISINKSFINEANNDHSGLPQDEQLIMRCLSEGDSYPIDKLHTLTKLPLSQVMPALTMLEIRGLVAKRADGLYESTGSSLEN
jgi:DNA processing protein